MSLPDSPDSPDSPDFPGFLALPDFPGFPALPDRKETEVRRMLAGPHPPVPPDLAARATARGRRFLAHRRTLHRIGWLLALLALAALTWAALAQPWLPPPVHTTPPVEGW